MDATAELGRNPVCKHQIQPEYGDEQADAGRDCRTRLTRSNSQARTNADRGILFFPVQLTTCRTGNLTRLIHTLLYVMTIHTYMYIHRYIHTYVILGMVEARSVNNNVKNVHTTRTYNNNNNNNKFGTMLTVLWKP